MKRKKVSLEPRSELAPLKFVQSEGRYHNHCAMAPVHDNLLKNPSHGEEETLTKC